MSDFGLHPRVDDVAVDDDEHAPGGVRGGRFE